MRKSRRALPARGPASSSDLIRAAAQLPVEALHHWIEARRVADCGELAAALSPGQFAALLDVQLWRSPRPGTPEELDAFRFGEWVEVLAEQGLSCAAERLAALDPGLLVASLAPHVAVFDPAVLERSDEAGLLDSDTRLRADIGGYVVFSRESEAWDAIVAVLTEMTGTHTDAFHRTMRGCRRLSNSTPEPDGFHGLMLDPAQATFDLAVEREQRREQLGYVPPEQARAFLQAARGLSLAQPRPPRHHPITGAALAAARDGSGGTAAEQLVFLANVLVAGGTIQGRAFTPPEAADAVAATCRLGVVNWPAHWEQARPAAGTVALVRSHRREAASPVAAFMVGWRLLYSDVCMGAARRLLSLLGELATAHMQLRPDLLLLRQRLQRECDAGTPWRAHPAFDVLQVLDMATWAALVALTGEYPVLLGNVAAPEGARVTSVSPATFELIENNRQRAAVRRFLERAAVALAAPS